MEAHVAHFEGAKVWVRDNEGGGICYYKGDSGKPIAQERITLWLPVVATKTRADRKSIVSKCLSDFVKEHPLNTDTSTTSERDTPSVYTTAQSDFDILQLYHSDESIPDEKAATLISEAKARAHNMVPVPASVVMAAKRNALDAGLDDPWDSMVYRSHLECVRGSGRKHKRSVTPPREKSETYKAIFDDHHAKVAERWDALRKRLN